jgi:hypothetical protein
VKRPLGIVGAAASFATGMVLWIGGTVGWNHWRTSPVAAAPAVNEAAQPKAKAPEEDLGELYASAGRKILDEYRRSPDPTLSKIDWHKAEIFFERAIDLSPRDERLLGDLAISRGYAALERLTSRWYSDSASALLRQYARDQFLTAAQKMPGSADPQLALRELALREAALSKPVTKAPVRRRRWR